MGKRGHKGRFEKTVVEPGDEYNRACGRDVACCEVWSLVIIPLREGEKGECAVKRHRVEYWKRSVVGARCPIIPLIDTSSCPVTPIERDPR